MSSLSFGKLLFLALFFAACATRVREVSPPPGKDSPAVTVVRKYRPGQKLKYLIEMHQLIDDKESGNYEAIVSGTTMLDSQQTPYESFEWLSLHDEDGPTLLDAATRGFRQVLSLAPPFKLGVPGGLASIRPRLVGPVTDLLTFYVDESLIIQQNQLQHAGDLTHINTLVQSSWGAGQDCLNFDVQILKVDPVGDRVTVGVSHVPPEKFCLNPPVTWMKEQVADRPNNWFNVEGPLGAWTASVGKETFDVQLEIQISTGIIQSAVMHNPVIMRTRSCRDPRLHECLDPVRHQLVRDVKFTLQP